MKSSVPSCFPPYIYTNIFGPFRFCLPRDFGLSSTFFFRFYFSLHALRLNHYFPILHLNLVLLFSKYLLWSEHLAFTTRSGKYAHMYLQVPRGNVLIMICGASSPKIVGQMIIICGHVISFVIFTRKWPNLEMENAKLFRFSYVVIFFCSFFSFAVIDWRGG